MCITSAARLHSCWGERSSPTAHRLAPHSPTLLRPAHRSLLGAVLRVHRLLPARRLPGPCACRRKRCALSPAAVSACCCMCWLWRHNGCLIYAGAQSAGPSRRRRLLTQRCAFHPPCALHSGRRAQGHALVLPHPLLLDGQGQRAGGQQERGPHRQVGSVEGACGLSGGCLWARRQGMSCGDSAHSV